VPDAILYWLVVPTEFGGSGVQWLVELCEKRRAAGGLRTTASGSRVVRHYKADQLRPPQTLASRDTAARCGVNGRSLTAFTVPARVCRVSLLPVVVVVVAVKR